MLSFLPIHLLVITIFFILRFINEKINNYSPTQMLPSKSVLPKYLTIPFLLISMFAIQGISNRTQLSNRCNVDMTQTAFMTSAITIFLIFGTIVVLAESIPILKSPFDNTFGYLLCGLNMETIRTVVNKVYIPNIRSGESNVMESILNNEGLMINTVTPNTFQMKLLPLNIQNTKRSNDFMMKYYNLVLKKDLIGSFVFYILAAVLAVIINSESINNIKCKRTDENIIKNLSSVDVSEI
jgi:hypothetical protein